MKINPAPLHIAQSVLLGLVCALSVTIIGTSSHTLAVFNNEQSTNPWWLPLWPQHFNVNPTKALVGTSVAILALSAVFLVFALIPRFNLVARPTLRALLALGTAIPGALITLITVIYAHIANNGSPELDTIQTWTCKYRNGKAMAQNMEIPEGMGNEGFNSLCRESKFALYATLVVCVILSASVGLSVVTWLADKWAVRQDRKEAEMGSIES